MRRKPGNPCPENFFPTFSTEQWIRRTFPVADLEATLEVFRDKAAAGGWMYSDWQAALRNYFRNSVKYGGVVYQGGRDFDPRWKGVLIEARAEGFEEPRALDTPQSYRTRLDTWRRESSWRNGQLKPALAGALKRVPH